MHTTEWDRDELRKTLREIMTRAGLSQTAVGELAGRNRSMANRWLAGHNRPTFEAATALAAAIRADHPDLADRLLAAAGYRVDDHDRSPPPIRATQDRADSTKRVVEELRKIASKEDKSIGDVLVERGLATPEELTLSEQKRGDSIVRDILASDMPEETKNLLLLDYVADRRHEYRKRGLIGGPEKK